MKNLTDFQALFAQYLDQHQLTQEPVALYQPVNYIMQLGGKRIRPVLALMGCSLFDDDAAKALPVALAVEVFHNFTLVHDDIMDKAPLRRGQPTLHAKYGLTAGILSGDVMLILAYEHLLQLGDLRVLQIFNKVAREVCEGQQYDMDFETRAAVSIDEYIHMIALKTAVLLAGSLEMGALTGGASPDDAEHLSAFGRHLGIAFQLQDDYLDTFGDPDKFGKKVGGDIAQNKKTFLIIKAMELASPAQRAELASLMANAPADEAAKIARAKDILQDLQVPRHARQAMQAHQDQAFAHLAAVAVPAARKQCLTELAELLFEREI